MTHDNKPILRVQDRRGRGPYAPGFSDKWANPERTWCPPTVFEEIPNLRSLLDEWQGWHFGCCVRGWHMLHRWFLDDEISRLHQFGFSIVEVTGGQVLAETSTQIVFVRKRPFKHLRSISLVCR